MSIEAFRRQKPEIIAAFADLARRHGHEPVKIAADDGRDLSLRRRDGGAVIGVRIKSRWIIDRRYLGGDVWMAFPVGDTWCLAPHRELVRQAEARGYTRSSSWRDAAIYSIPSPPRKLVEDLERFRLGPIRRIGAAPRRDETGPRRAERSITPRAPRDTSAREWMRPSPDVLAELHEPLARIGRRWAASSHRPRPAPAALAAWDDCLRRWADSDLPLILRNMSRLSDRAFSRDGRAVVFADNMPANWAYGMALDGQVPDMSGWTPQTLPRLAPMSFLNRNGMKKDLNAAGWKVCHIEGVSDGVRYKVEDSDSEALKARFIRFLSPRNMFLVPKVIAGAGELPEMISAIKAFEAAEAEAGDAEAWPHEQAVAA